MKPSRSITRGALSATGERGWVRRGMIVLLLVMLVGAIGGVGQMVGAVGARGGPWGGVFLFGLLSVVIGGVQACAFA